MKMIANFSYIILKHTSPICRSTSPFSLSVRSLSTPTETQIGSTPRVFDILVQEYNFPPEFASRVASVLSHIKNSHRAVSVLSFLKDNGFSNTQLMKMAKYRTRFLSYSLEGQIKPKIKILQEVGLSSGEICRVISNNPSILELSVENNIIPSLSLIKGFLETDNDVSSVIKRSPRFLTANLGNTLVPNVEFLKSNGVPIDRIRVILTAYPGSLTTKHESLKRSVEIAKEMGLRASSASFIYAISTIAKLSYETWELKLQAFRDLGFSDDDILTMFSKAPLVFYGSVEKIKKVVELLIGTGKFNMSGIVNYPISLAFSIEKRYKPRFQILGILESKNLIKEWPNLQKICSLSDDKFFEKVVAPYSNEVSTVSLVQKRRR